MNAPHCDLAWFAPHVEPARKQPRESVGCGELEREVIERFAAAQASKAENRLVVRHLLTRCAKCGAAINSILRPVTPPDAYADLLSKLGRRNGQLPVVRTPRVEDEPT